MCRESTKDRGEETVVVSVRSTYLFPFGSRGFNSVGAYPCAYGGELAASLCRVQEHSREQPSLKDKHGANVCAVMRAVSINLTNSGWAHACLSLSLRRRRWARRWWWELRLRWGGGM